MPAKGPSGGVGMVSVDGPAESDQSLAQAFGAGGGGVTRKLGLDGGVQGRRPTAVGDLGGRRRGAKPQGPLNHPQPPRRSRAEEQVHPLQDFGAAMLHESGGGPGDPDFQHPRSVAAPGRQSHRLGPAGELDPDDLGPAGLERGRTLAEALVQGLEKGGEAAPGRGRRPPRRAGAPAGEDFGGFGQVKDLSFQTEEDRKSQVRLQDTIDKLQNKK